MVRPDGASIGATWLSQWYPMVERGLYLGGVGCAHADALIGSIHPRLGASRGQLRPAARNFGLTLINYFG
jgi:hypothetical protein